MQTWIALLRGINVGGRNKMPMKDLSKVLEAVGCRSVRTYIQSGNVVFESSSKSKNRLTKKIIDAIESRFKFRPNVLLVTCAEFRSSVRSNPFPQAAENPKTLHFFFLESEPESPDVEGIAELASPTERFELIGSVFYLHTPDGFGRSKLAAGAERKLGVPATARNFTTICKLTEMLDAESLPSNER